MNSVGILSTLHPEIDARFEELSVLNETRDRARGALMLFYGASGHQDNWRDEAYIRAGLNEFYSIEATLRREHKAGRLEGSPREIETSRNPLLHLMLLMRHVNVHATTCVVTTHQATVTSHLGNPHDYTYTASVIRDLSVEQLLRRRETAQSYQRLDLERIVSWFLDKQQVFGVPEIFTAGTEQYCREFLLSV